MQIIKYNIYRLDRRDKFFIIITAITLHGSEAPAPSGLWRTYPSLTFPAHGFFCESVTEAQS